MAAPRLGRFWIAGLILFASIATAAAQKRVALVIGNGGYQNAAKLSNPVNDATAMADLFKAAGFDVVDSRRDLGIANMRRALREFVDQARDAEIGVVYYAGHGIEVDGTNYLVPVDAVLERDADVEDETLSLDRVIRALEPIKRLRVVILDACRDNPFTRNMKRIVGSRAIGRGLAKVEVATSDTLIAFAAKAGSTALDGDGKNSPYTSALLRYITKPGVDLRIAFGQVRDDVLAATQNKQEPFYYGSLGGTAVSLVPAPRTPAAPAVDGLAEARRDYEFAERVNTKAVWESFLSVHGNGLYAELARAMLGKITAAESAVLDRAKAAEKKAADEVARLAEAARSEQARLTAERVRAEELARQAAEKAKAEVARLEAEKAKLEEQAKIAAEKAKVELAKAVEQARQAAERAKTVVVASASKDAPDGTASPSPAGPAIGELTRSIQTELRRVGCYTASIDGEWNVAARKAVDTFNRYSGLKLENKVANLDTLDAVKQKQSRVCPIECGKGFRADGERCTRVVCQSGFHLNDDGECARIPERPSRSARGSAPSAGAAPTAPAGPTIECGKSGCVPVKPGCKVDRSINGSIVTVPHC